MANNGIIEVTVGSGLESEVGQVADELRFDGGGWNYNSFINRYVFSEEPTDVGDISFIINSGYDEDTEDALLIDFTACLFRSIEHTSSAYEFEMDFDIRYYTIDETYDDTLDDNDIGGLSKTLISESSNNINYGGTESAFISQQYRRSHEDFIDNLDVTAVYGVLMMMENFTVDYENNTWPSPQLFPAFSTRKIKQG